MDTPLNRLWGGRAGPNGVPDANPEVVIVGSPLDGTKNPKVSLGKQFADITGIIAYQ